MNELQIFKNDMFGEIRTIEIDGKPYFVASDVAKALGYINTSKAISDHCRWVTKRYIPHPQSPNKSLSRAFVTSRSRRRKKRKAAKA